MQTIVCFGNEILEPTGKKSVEKDPSSPPSPFITEERRKVGQFRILVFRTYIIPLLTVARESQNDNTVTHMCFQHIQNVLKKTIFETLFDKVTA